MKEKGDFEKVNGFGLGNSNDAYAKYFIGKSYLNGKKYRKNYN